MKSNVFDPNNDIPDLHGRVFVLTGGSAGIGFGILAHLLQHHPEKIYLLSNKEEHAHEALEELREWGDISKVEWVQCDLASLDQSNSVAQRLKDQVGRLDGLILNAGLGVGKYWETKDGIGNTFGPTQVYSLTLKSADSHFQVNFLSQMLLGLTLLPTLLKTAQMPSTSPRFVMMSSDLHRATHADTSFTSKSEINTDIGPMRLYNRSKLAQVLFVRELSRQLSAGRYGPGKIYVNATHPGGVVTDQQEQAVEAYGTIGKLGVKAVRPFMKDPIKSGCKSGLFAAVSDDVVTEDVTGAYIVPDRKVTSPSKQAEDSELALSLWKLSEQLLREKFDGRLPYQD